MTKMLIIDFERCRGCRLCEIVCSAKHTDTCNPARANIHVVKWDEIGFFFPMRCQQCDDAACMTVCPRKAIYRDEDRDHVLIDYDQCIGCKACIIACPFGAMSYDVVFKKVIKCDLCDGDPLCVKFCPVEVIDYIDANNVNFRKMRNAAYRFADLVSNVQGKEEENKDRKS